MRYRPEIDGLRTVAVLPVVMFHAGVPFLSGGYIGVDIFFVISGYLITSIIYEDLRNSNFSIVSFYERRARRILPALFLVMCCTFMAGWLILPPDNFREFSESLVSVSLFSSNVYFWLTGNYFSPAAEQTPLLHTWSLSIEEQYYVLFPIVLYGLWKYFKKEIVIVIMGLAGISLILSATLTNQWTGASFYLLHTRAWELLAGALCAFLLHKRYQGDFVSLQTPLATIGLLLIAISIFLFDAEVPFPGWHAAMPVAGTCLVIMFAREKSVICRWLSAPPLVGIGLMSYSLYLWHQPLYALYRVRNEGESDVIAMGILTLLAFALAYLSWKFVESHFRSKHLVSRAGIFRGACLGLIVFTVAGAGGAATNGYAAWRVSEPDRRVLETARFSPKRSECHTDSMSHYSPADACEYFHSTKLVAVVGDSHAVELAYALASRLQASNIGVKHFSFSGCPPMYGRSDVQSGCGQWTTAVMDYVLASDISTVVVSYRLYSHLFGPHQNEYPKQPQQVSAQERELRWRSLVAMVAELENHGKTVLLVLQAPEVRRSLPTLVFHSEVVRGEMVGVTRQWWDERKRFVGERLDVLPESVRVLDPTDLFCDMENCLAVHNGVARYFDDHHLSIAGADEIALNLVEGIRNSLQEIR